MLAYGDERIGHRIAARFKRRSRALSATRRDHADAALAARLRLGSATDVEDTPSVRAAGNLRAARRARPRRLRGARARARRLPLRGGVPGPDLRRGGTVLDRRLDPVDRR